MTRFRKSAAATALVVWYVSVSLLVAVFVQLPTNTGRVASAFSVSSSASTAAANRGNGGGGGDDGGIRLNKVFKKTHSRREADALIESGRVAVNGVPVTEKGGFLVRPYVDEISLDGTVVEGWEEMNSAARDNQDDENLRQQQWQSQSVGKERSSNKIQKQREQFEYIKYWKPRGVTCTTDPKVPENIITAIRRDGYRPPHRVYPVGRLDKDTSGLILLTSDGRLPNAALRSKNKRPKVYEVRVDKPIRQKDLQRWRDGVVITTETVRNGVRKSTTAKTLPCKVEKLGGDIDPRLMRMTLVEGRNWQVRKMTEALGYRTEQLERVEFACIGLDHLDGPGDWAPLDRREQKIVEDLLRDATTEEY